jgi:hypothetical protein
MSATPLHALYELYGFCSYADKNISNKKTRHAGNPYKPYNPCRLLSRESSFLAALSPFNARLSGQGTAALPTENVSVCRQLTYGNNKKLSVHVARLSHRQWCQCRRWHAYRIGNGASAGAALSCGRGLMTKHVPRDAPMTTKTASRRRANA